MGIRMIYSDPYLCVCIKPVGVTSEGEGMPSMLKSVFPGSDVFPVHRLDQSVGGVMVYALKKDVAARLTEMFAGSEVCKEYLAVIPAVPEETEGIFTDWLWHDKRNNKTYVVKSERKGVKKAELAWILLRSVRTDKDTFSLVRVALHTGRTHQIRIQFASRKMPLIGDGKYGSRIKSPSVGLWSYRLTFRHPVTGEMLDFSREPDYSASPFDLVSPKTAE